MIGPFSPDEAGRATGFHAPSDRRLTGQPSNRAGPAGAPEIP
mgnify:CR=1 FL=1